MTNQPTKAPAMRRKLPANCSLPLPDLATQQSIVDLATLAEKQQRLLAKLAEKKKQLMTGACLSIAQDGTTKGFFLFSPYPA